MYVEKQCEQVKVSRSRWRRWESDRRARRNAAQAEAFFSGRDSGLIPLKFNRMFGNNQTISGLLESEGCVFQAVPATDKAPTTSANSC